MSDHKNQEKKPASLAFRLVATYFWPFSGGKWHKYEYKGLRHEFTQAAKVIGRGTKFAAVVAASLAAHQIIQPATGMLFPTAEDYMRKNNLDPALAQQLSDSEIHIRGRDFLGRLHVTMDFPTIIGMMAGGTLSNIENNAFAFQGIQVGGYGMYSLLNQCNTYLLQEDATAKEMIANLANIDEDYIENVPLTDHELHITVAFHEFAHCSSENSADSILLREADADARGVWLAAQALNNPEIVKAFIYGRALATRAHDHDVALYIDAQYRGVALPDSIDIKNATTDVFDLARMYEDRFLYATKEPAHINKALALQGVLNEYGNLLSESGKRRAELYIEAVRYFMPEAAKVLTYQSSNDLGTINAPAAPALTQ